MAMRGRRIIYDMTNGKVIFDFGEAVGDVQGNPEIGSTTALRFLDLPYGQDAELFERAKAYHVDHETKTVIFDELEEG